MPHEPSTDRPRPVLQIGILVCTIYFVEEVADPSGGFLNQPLNAILTENGFGPASLALFNAILLMPWVLKPFSGFLSDAIPLFGYHRKSYLVLMGLLATVALLALGVVPHTEFPWAILFALVLLPGFALAFMDVVIDALMVERGQPTGMTGRFQSIALASLSVGSALSGLTGGLLSATRNVRGGFFLAAILCGFATLLSWRYKEERSRNREPIDVAALKANLRTLRSSSLPLVGVFLFLWELHCIDKSLLYVHLINHLKMTPLSYGIAVSAGQVGSLGACLLYGIYCRRLSTGALVHAAIVAGLLNLLPYLALGNHQYIVWLYLIAGFFYMLGNLIVIDFVSRIIPTWAAGTLFALFMSLCNFADAIGIAVYGQLYEWAIPRWGEPAAFQVLLAVGILITAGCWVFSPALNRIPTRLDDVAIEVL